MGNRNFVPDIAVTVAQFPPGTFVAVGGTNFVAALEALAPANGGLANFDEAAGPYKVQFFAEGGAFRMADNGIILTAALGFPLPVNTIFIYDANQLTQLKLLEQAAGTLNAWITRLRA